MPSTRAIKSSGLVAAFVLGLLLAGPAGRLVTGAAASADPAAPTNAQLAAKIAELDIRMAAAENTGASSIAIRPGSIQVTPPPAADPLTALQQRVDSLERTLFGPPVPPGGRPKPIQTNVIGQMQQQLDDSTSKLNSVQSGLEQVTKEAGDSASTLKLVQSGLGDLSERITKLQTAFLNHRHNLNDAKPYQIVVGGVSRFFPGSGGQLVFVTTPPYCGGYAEMPGCVLQ